MFYNHKLCCLPFLNLGKPYYQLSICSLCRKIMSILDTVVGIDSPYVFLTIYARWVNLPSCESCGSDTANCGMGAPHPSELQFGGSRVELYRYEIFHILYI